MPTVLTPWNDNFSIFLKVIVGTQTHQEHAGQFWIEVIVDVQIAVLQQVNVLLHHKGVIRVCKPIFHHCSLQIVGVMEPQNQTVTTLFIFYEQYTT